MYMIPFTSLAVKEHRTRSELREYAMLEGVSLNQLRTEVRRRRRDNPIMRRLYSRSLYADVRCKECENHSWVYHFLRGRACC